MTPQEAKIYSVMTYRWQLPIEIERKLKEQNIDLGIFGSIIVYLHSLEDRKLIESIWQNPEPTPEDQEERGGARRRVYRKKAGGSLILDGQNAPDNGELLPGLVPT